MKKKIIAILALITLNFYLFSSFVFNQAVFAETTDTSIYDLDDDEIQVNFDENQILEEIGVKVFDEDDEYSDNQENVENEVVEEDDEIADTISQMSEYIELRNIGLNIPDAEKESAVTREKAAFYVATLSNKQAEDVDETYYVDVVLSNKYLKYINACTVNRYMTGKGDKFFYPSEDITVTDFVVAIFRMANYEQYAQFKGGYTKGYTDLAREYGLLKGVDIAASKILTNGNAIKIMYNALSLPVCGISGAEDGGLKYSIDKDRLVADEFFDISKKKGVICATYDAALYGYSSCNSDSLVINDGTNNLTFRCSSGSYEKYLGANVYYYTDKNGKIINVSYCAQPTVIDIDFFNIDYMSIDRKTVKYINENGNNKRLNINSDAIFFYNGKQYNGIIPDDLQKPQTYTEFVDTENDGRYDLVFVWCADVILAERLPNPKNTMNVGFTDSRVDTDVPQYPQEAYEEWKENGSFQSFAVSEWTTGKTYELNNSSNDYRLSMYLDGETIDYFDLSTNDLLSIYESKDKEKKTVYVSKNHNEYVVGGIVTDEHKIKLNDNDHIYSFDINDMQRLYNKEATIYFDHRGVAAAYRLTSQSEPEYGYLMNFKIRRKDDIGIAEIYTMDKKIIRFELEEKFKCNDKKGKVEDVKTHFDLTNHQLIKYVLSEDGKISKLYFSTEINPADPIEMPTPGYSLKKEKPIFTLNEHYNGTGGKYGIYNARSLEMEYDANVTKRLVVVVDASGNIVDDLVYTVSSFTSNKLSDIKVYDARAGKIANFMVLTVTEDDYNTYIASQNVRLAVSKIYETIDGKVLEGLNGNYLLKFYENSKGDFDGLKKGDVIRVTWYITDEAGHYFIMKYQKLFTTESTGTEDKSVTICADDTTYSPTNKAITDGTNSYSKQIYGTVKSISPLDTTDDIHVWKYVMTIQPVGTSSAEDRYVISYNRVGAQLKIVPILFDTSTKTLSRAEPSQLAVGSKVFVVTANFEASMIVIYR